MLNIWIICIRDFLKRKAKDDVVVNIFLNFIRCLGMMDFASTLLVVHSFLNLYISFAPLFMFYHSFKMQGK